MKVMMISLAIFAVSLLLAGNLKAATAHALEPIMGVPGEVFDLANWKLTVPTSTDNKKPTEIKQPELASYKSVHFYTSNNLLVFTAPVGGFHTVGSHYPRSELREMDGKALSSWSTVSGTHTMIVEQCIVAVPKVKDHVVAGQIHNENDVITIRLEGKHLFGQSDGVNRGDMD
ncbi:MAG: polysaccharide lyase family 7 protein, partial [Spirochaetia bacterium]|nr:polysaccharide lyase family 7 protein [Spirochaetia bacterium]